MKKRILSIALVLVLVLSAIMPIWASAATVQEYSVNVKGTKFQISGSKFTISGLPKEEKYKFIWLELLDASGLEVYSEIENRVGYGNVTFDLSNVGAGTYKIDLYYSSLLYSTYDFLICGDAELQWMGTTGAFLTPEMYPTNRTEYESKRTDLAALAYYVLPSNRIESQDGAIIEKANEITRGLTDDYDKARAIFAWVANNVWYDMDILNGRAEYEIKSAKSVLQSRYTICVGYSNLTIALCRAVGIPAKTVGGYGRGWLEDWPRDTVSGNLSNHEWCEVFIDGHWAILDPTWASNNSYEFGSFTKSEGLLNDRYFDSALVSFSADHYIWKTTEEEVADFAQNTEKDAIPFTGNITLNGKTIYLTAYNIEDYNYFKLRDVAGELNRYQGDIEVGWDEASRSILVKTNSKNFLVQDSLTSKPYLPFQTATIPSAYLVVDGETCYTSAYNVNGNTYLKLRDLASILEFEVGYNSWNNEVLINN